MPAFIPTPSTFMTVSPMAMKKPAIKPLRWRPAKKPWPLIRQVLTCNEELPHSKDINTKLLILSLFEEAVECFVILVRTQLHRARDLERNRLSPEAFSSPARTSPNKTKRLAFARGNFHWPEAGGGPQESTESRWQCLVATDSLSPEGFPTGWRNYFWE